MTDIELSRRSIFAMAGAGVAAAALTGCAGSGTKGDSSAEETDNYGEDPNGAKTLDRGKYNPVLMAVVHITSAGPWAISSNHAHFDFAQPDYDPAARTAHAGKILLNKLGGKLARFRDAPRGSPYQVFDRAPQAPVPDFADYLEFANFGFGEPHDIYFFIEHAPGELSFDPKRLLGFSRMLLSGKKGNKNQAFDNAEIVAGDALPAELARLGTLIRLDNFCTVKDDTGYHQLPYGDVKSQSYKLNLYYKSRSGIAMAIDPDTGNGYGNGPRN
jgi:hypothetical protein